MTFGFQLHPEAANDLTDIWEYISERSPKGASSVREAILKAIRGLIAFPNKGHTRADLTSRPLRFCVTGNYLIAYAPDEKPLCVVAIIHGRRSPRVIAAILRGRVPPPPSLE